MKNVLIVEDQNDIARLIKINLTDLPCHVEHAADGVLGFQMVEQKNYDLVILDIMLPGVDGFEICRCIRKQANYTPILMLTSKSSELDRVLGLELGADDYVTKPFSIRELVARVKALFRRVDALGGSGDHAEKNRMNLGSMVIDVEKHSVFVGEENIDLTAKEFDLLLQFASHPGRVYTRAQLLDTVWGYGNEGYEHTVNSHINRLRNKIEKDPANPEYILTVWGVGYKCSEEVVGK